MSKTPQRGNKSLKSFHGIMMTETQDGNITVTCDGRQLYNGPSWQDANNAVLTTFYGLSWDTAGAVTLDPARLKSDPIQPVLSTTGLEPLEQAA